jgi:hypothetical protein
MEACVLLNGLPEPGDDQAGADRRFFSAGQEPHRRWQRLRKACAAGYDFREVGEVHPVSRVPRFVGPSRREIEGGGQARCQVSFLESAVLEPKRCPPRPNFIVSDSSHDPPQANIIGWIALTGQHVPLWAIVRGRCPRLLWIRPSAWRRWGFGSGFESNHALRSTAERATSCHLVPPCATRPPVRAAFDGGGYVRHAINGCVSSV